MKRLTAALIMASLLWLAPTADANPRTAGPFISCIDGHLVKNLADCPPLPRHRNDRPPPVGGGSGGLLGGLLGGIL